jgi:transaldolase/glucose-6-phosphate isomerase
LLPAALIGMDLDQLLSSASDMASTCSADAPLNANPAAWLGAILGRLAIAGRDKLTFVLSPGLSSFGDWVEQLIAESTGKEGKGIFPVVGEALAEPQTYSPDRLFVSLSLAGEQSDSAALDDLQAAGHPVLRFAIDDAYYLGGQFLLWELATAIAGYFLGINPFDQPNVEAAKQSTRQMMAAYKGTGTLPEQIPALQAGGSSVFGAVESGTPGAALKEFISQANPGDYIALQAFLQPTESTTDLLQELRSMLHQRSRLAGSFGYGPRYLHSTGQLHKGDRGNGLFIQFSDDGGPLLPIPDEINSPEASISFGTLKMAQALGDNQALQDAGRRVIRFHLDDIDALRRLLVDLGS